MSDWMREARRGAAWQFGSRHYRGFAAFEAAGGAGKLLGRLLLGAVLFVGVAIGGGLIVQAGRTVHDLSLPWLWMGVGIGVVVLVAMARTGVLAELAPLLVLGALAGLAWLGWRAVTAWSLPWGWMLAGATGLALLVTGRLMLLLVLGTLAGLGGATWWAATTWPPLLWIAGATALLIAAFFYRSTGGLLALTAIIRRPRL